MPDTNRQPASTILRQTAVEQEAALLGKNEFREDSAEYDATKVPTEIDGAKEERIKLTVMNTFNGDNEYKNPDGTNP